MSNLMVHDKDKIVAALTQIEGEYRAAPGVRNMLLIIAAMVLPLLTLIVTRLLNHLVPPPTGLVSGSLIALAIFGVIVEFVFGALRISAAGVERHSPWRWLSWHVGCEDIKGLGSADVRGGRHLVLETLTGRRYHVPFRSGFERILPLLE